MSDIDHQFKDIKRDIGLLKKKINATDQHDCKRAIKEIEDQVLSITDQFLAVNKKLERKEKESLVIEEKLSKNERYLQTIYENLDVAIFVIDITESQEFIFQGLNPTHEKLTGMSTAKVKNKRPSEFLDPDFARMVEANYQRCLDEGRTIEYEEKLILEGRETFWITRLIPVKDKNNQIWRIIGSSLHITELKESQAAIMREKLFLNTLINTIPDPLFYKNRHLKYLGCNKAFEEMIGIHRNQLINKSVFEISPKELATEYNKMDEILIKSQSTQSYEEKIMRHDGSIRNVIFNKAVYYNEKEEIEGIVGIIHDITEQKAYQEILKDLSIKDQLTEIYNRRGFLEISQGILKKSVRDNQLISVLMMDIDYFKKYNDTYGHQEGDNCLKIVAKVIRQACMRPLDLVARYGGEEFIALLPETSFENALIVAQRVLTAIKKINIPHKGSPTHHITISIGVASSRIDQSRDLNNLIEQADKSLYNAKTKGRNRVEGYKVL